VRKGQRHGTYAQMHTVGPRAGVLLPPHSVSRAFHSARHLGEVSVIHIAKFLQSLANQWVVEAVDPGLSLSSVGNRWPDTREVVDHLSNTRCRRSLKTTN
jgi:hypothetical protein